MSGEGRSKVDDSRYAVPPMGNNLHILNEPCSDWVKNPEDYPDGNLKSFSGGIADEGERR
jgi:hypothetical protein